MKFSINILVLLVLSLIGCKETKPVIQTIYSQDEYENRFFTLDFNNDEIGLDELKAQFFTTFPHNDPTQGNVVYDKAKWIHDDILQLKSSEGLFAYTKFRDNESGYDSYRLTTKAFYNLNEETEKILFVFKGKLPSANGMWPAWWLNGSKENTWIYEDSMPATSDEKLNKYSGKGNFYDTSSSVNSTDWPSAGEIDIIENINGENKIHNTLHTCPRMCDSEWNNDGNLINCANAKSGNINPGCSGKSYEINELEGTFACLWGKESIKFYYWENESDVNSPGGPLGNNPKPEKWGKDHLKNSVKLVETNTPCSNTFHQIWQCKNCAESDQCTFKNMKMIFNATLCGVWAGNVFDSTPNAFKNCQQFIMNDGKSDIHNQSMKIEYVSVRSL